MPVSQAHNPDGYFAVAHLGCSGCVFNKEGCDRCDRPLGEYFCGADKRSDKTNVIFKKGKLPKLKLDKDAAWMLRYERDYNLNPHLRHRLLAIAKRLNGGKLP